MDRKPPAIHISAKVVIRTDDEFAFITYPSNYHDLPGGHIEYGETVLSGLRREIMEEFGYELPVEPTLVDIYDHLDESRQKHTLYIGYVVHLPEKPELKYIEYQDGTTLHWLHQDDVVQQKFIPAFTKFIQEAFSI